MTILYDTRHYIYLINFQKLFPDGARVRGRE